MGRLYTISHEVAALADARSLLSVTAGTGKPVVVRGIHVTNQDLATADQVSVSFDELTAGTYTGGGTPTVEKIGHAVAAGFTVEGDSTEGSLTYGGISWFHHGFNLQQGYHWEPTKLDDDYGAIQLIPADEYAVRMRFAPTAHDSLIVLLVEEFG